MQEITETLVQAIQREHDAAEASFQSAVAHAVRGGELLNEVRGQFKQGDWLPWLQASFTFTPRTAQIYMRLARNAKQVSHLPTLRDAIAELTAPKPTPTMTREEAERRMAETKRQIAPMLDKTRELQVELWGDLRVGYVKGDHITLGYDTWEEFVALGLLTCVDWSRLDTHGSGLGDHWRREYYKLCMSVKEEPDAE